ncbi:MAG: acetate kinase [Thalassobium sp.]|mgnify:FL=1|uniref:acetate/propionate family kinase n=1 Tax=Thalassolituus sp. TaxID=2030822 RepID=UPI000BCBF10A|nr:MAG: acetate kinase [Oceanospirillales bacterium]PHQ87781.1 MAG: acetate kinase [Thalassobium sp.]
MQQSVLVVNCGSSSIKLALYADGSASAPIMTALAERLGGENASLTIKGELSHCESGVMDHRQALSRFIELAKSQLNNLVGIGHRVVHGGEAFHSSTLLTESALAELRPISALAPLHNPRNLMGIDLCNDLLPGVPSVAVFDTSFHQSISEQVYLYGVPYDWYEQDQVRRYGFHGTSYRYVSQKAADLLQRPHEDLHLLIAHLGNGCSACAVRQGKSVDSSMGLTPLEGLVMGTRSGDIDPGLIEHMQQSRGMTLEQTMNALNRESGLQGLSAGLSNDMRTLLEAEKNGNEAAARAIKVFCFRVARNLAALSTSLPTIDAVVFTGGIGEHAAVIRQRILAAWRPMNFRLDDALNAQHGDQYGRISQTGSPLAMVVPTDEERMIAQDTYQLVTHD